MKKILSGISVMCLIAFASMVFAATPTDRGVDAAYGVVKSYNTSLDTCKSATDSAVIKSGFVIPGQQKGCLFVLALPKITGLGNDSVKAVLGVKCYTSEGTYLYKYMTTDTLSDSVGFRLVLPIETPLAPADKYDILFYGTTGAGGQAIFRAGKIYALQPFVRQKE